MPAGQNLSYRSSANASSAHDDDYATAIEDCFSGPYTLEIDSSCTDISFNTPPNTVRVRKVKSVFKVRRVYGARRCMNFTDSQRHADDQSDIVARETKAIIAIAALAPGHDNMPSIL